MALTLLLEAHWTARRRAARHAPQQPPNGLWRCARPPWLPAGRAEQRPRQPIARVAGGPPGGEWKRLWWQ